MLAAREEHLADNQRGGGRIGGIVVKLDGRADESRGGGARRLMETAFIDVLNVFIDGQANGADRQRGAQ